MPSFAVTWIVQLLGVPAPFVGAVQTGVRAATLLKAPLEGNPWHEASFRAEQWADSDAVRGVAGIHARRMPCDWRRVDPGSFPEVGRCDVHGIVERFGRYVLGTEGWRAEWVVIRELMAPDTKTALAMMQRYPEVKVHVREKETSHEDR